MDLFLAFCVWASSWILLLLMGLLFLIPYFILQLKAGPAVSADSPEAKKQVILITLLSIIPAHALTLGVAWAVVTRWRKRPFWETLRWRWPKESDRQGRIIRVGVTVALAIALQALSYVIAKYLPGGETDIDQIIKSSLAARLLTAFLATATAPLVEEIVYRGVLYPAVDRAFGKVWAVLVVTLMFALVHVPQYYNSVAVVTAILMLSLVLTIVRAYTESLFYCFLLHLFFNGATSIAILLELDRPATPEKSIGTVVQIFRLITAHFGG